MLDLGIGPQELEPLPPVDVTVRPLKSSAAALMSGDEEEGQDQAEGPEDGIEISDWSA